MTIKPVKLLTINMTNKGLYANWTADDGTGDPYLNKPYQWTVDLHVDPQYHGSPYTRTPYQYDGFDIIVGDWIVTSYEGKSVRVVSINVATQTGSYVNCVVEDVDRYNIFTDPTASGVGIGQDGFGFAFQLDETGLPLLIPIPTGILPDNFQVDLISRFTHRNLCRKYYKVKQANHGFVQEDMIYLTSSGTYSKATAANSTTANIIGIVKDAYTYSTSHTLDWFAYEPVGEVVQNISPALPGNPGDVIYLSATGGYTATKPTTVSKPIYVRLEVGSKGIKLNRGTESSTWSSITNTPTTISGYGITDAVSSTRKINAGTGLSGGGTLTSDVTISLANTGVIGSTAGSTTSVPIIGYNQQGQLTTVSSVTITPNWTSITNKPSTLSGYGIKDALSISGGTLTGSLTLQSDPTGNLDAATKQYVDHKTISTGTGLQGGGDLSTNRTISIADTGVTGSIAGSSSVVPIIGYNQQGQLTSVGSATITPSSIGAALEIHNQNWTTITNAPSTISGYGIVDGLHIVNNIAERDALTAVTGLQVYVNNIGNGNWGYYIYNGSNYVLVNSNAPPPTPTETEETVTVTINIHSVSPITIFTIPADAQVTVVELEVTTEFDDHTATLIIGNDNDNSAHMSDDLNDLSSLGVYEGTHGHQYTIDTPIKAYFNFHSSTVGEAIITISYS